MIMNVSDEGYSRCALNSKATFLSIPCTRYHIYMYINTVYIIHCCKIYVHMIFFRSCLQEVFLELGSDYLILLKNTSGSGFQTNLVLFTWTGLLASPIIVMKIVLKCIWQVIMANGMTFNVLIGGNSYVKSLNKVLLIHYIKHCMYFFSNKPN